jgi:hypothetical protein
MYKSTRIVQIHIYLHLRHNQQIHAIAYTYMYIHIRICTGITYIVCTNVDV